MGIESRELAVVAANDDVESSVTGEGLTLHLLRDHLLARVENTLGVRGKPLARIIRRLMSVVAPPDSMLLA